MNKKVKIKFLAGIIGAALLVIFNNCNGGFKTPATQELFSNSQSETNPIPVVVQDQVKLTDFQADQLALEADSDFNFQLKLRYEGKPSLPSGYKPFLHFVSSNQPEWFEFSLFPVSGPDSSTWAGEVLFSGQVRIPANAFGSYKILVGLNNGSNNSTSPNIQLNSEGKFVESFQSGAIGYRYEVGTLEVKSKPPSDTSVLEIIISDMKLPNDAPANSGDTSRRAGVQMGLMGRGDYTQNYWNPNDKSLKSPTWWKAITPWWNLFPLVGNAATNTRVEIGAILVYVQNKADGRWRLLNRGYTSWALNYNANASAVKGNADAVPGSFTGAIAYLPPQGTDTVHGGSGSFNLDPQITSGIVVCLGARLTVNAKGGIDDRAKSNYGMWVGADWYPNTEFNVSKSVPEIGWVPAVGTSRLKKITNDWQPFCMTPLDPPGRNDGDSNSAGTSVPESVFRANPPPITLKEILQ